MKCVCGYYHMDDWEIELKEDAVFQDEIRKNNGNREFVKINGYFTVKSNNYYTNDSLEVALYACPRCGTIHIERSNIF